MQAVWMVRSRQITRKLIWWLTLLGYDPHDHSPAHRIYLVYASLFWSVWFFAVFSLFANPTITVLTVLGISPINQAAVALSLLALLSWGLYRLWQATRRSPFVFSENDAYLICQAPVDGRAVAVSWLLGDWFEAVAPFWVGAATLSIALVDYSLEGQVGLADLPGYLIAGLQALLGMSLAHIGLMSLVWAVGALRLQGDRQLHWQPSAARLGIVAFGTWIAFVVMRDGLSQPTWQVLLSPILLPLQSAFDVAPFLPGLIVGMVWAGLGLAALAWAGTGLNLSRAAQETTQKEKVETARRFGQNEAASQAALTHRLSGGRSPSRLPARPGRWMLGWKDAVQSTRAFSLSAVWVWVLFSTACLGVCLAPDIGSRALLLAIWVVMVGQRVTSRLQKDLALWGLLRLLPFSSDRLLVAELALPGALVVILSWIFLAFAGGAWLASTRLLVAVLLPFLVASISLATASDLLRRTRSDLLLAGSTPQNSAWGGLLGILCLALPLGAWFGVTYIKQNGGLPALVLAIFLTLVFRQVASRQLREMK